MKRSMAPNSPFENNTITHRRSSALIMVGIVCTLIMAVFANPATSYADSIPGGNVSDPVVRAVDIAKPSVVRIITELPSHLIVHLSQGDVTFPQTGSTNQDVQNGAYVLTLSGSGTFITSQGDILTADHVVNPPKDQEITQFLDQVAAPDVAAYINKTATGANQVTADQVNQQLNSGQLRSTPTFDQTTSEVFLSTDFSGPLDNAATLNDIPATLHQTVDKIEKESAANQRDVAIIHAPFTDTPSVQLGNSSNVQQQDELTIIGFPGNGDVSKKPTDLLTSSVNKINVSSIKTNDNGAPLIQVGGNVEQGDSGGPALDSNGNVVGIVSFGVVSNSATTAGTSFLQASSSASDLVKSLGLNTTPGTFQQLWSKAFTDYASTTPGHWHQTQTDFQQLQTKYPQFKAVTRYLDYASTQAKNEPQPKATAQATPTSTSNLPSLTSPSTLEALGITIGSGALIILLVVVLFRVALRRKKKPVPAQNNANFKGAVGDKQPVGAPFTSPPGPPNPPGPLPSNQPVPQGPAVSSTLPAVNNGMGAFGAPPRAFPPSQPSQTLPRGVPPAQPNTPINGNSGTFTTLRVWPCGHMNRSNARFCSICGEPAPQPPIRRVEQ
jgi:serine protease Do